MNDLKFAIRQLFKNPAFTLAAVVTVALGIGANTAIFSVLDAVLLKMLPVKNPEQLVVLTHAGGDRSGNGFSYPVFERLRDRNQSFSELFAFSTWPEVTLTVDTQDEPLPGGVLLVSGNYYSGLGVAPMLGRAISLDDNRVQGGHPVAVLSYRFWQRKFAADLSVIGRTISLNGTAFTIIGVTPPEFFGIRVGRSESVTIPIMMQAQIMPGAVFLRDSKNWDVEVMARPKPGVTDTQAMVELRVLFQQIELGMEGATISPQRLKIIQDRRIELAPASKGLSALRKQFAEPLRILMAVAGLVLLIACGNVANLLLARATARRKEIAVRLALGARRMRIVRQLLTESVLLALLGGAAGLLVAKWACSLCVALIPDRSGSIILNLSPDARILAFTAGVSLLTGILFGLVPALQTTRANLAPTLKESGERGSSHGLRRFWVGKGLMVAQVALTLVLLTGAGLFIRTFQNLKSLNPGFLSENVLLFSLDSRMRGSSPDQAFNLFKQLLERIATIPGVVSVAISRGGGERTRTDVAAEGSVAGTAGSRDVLDVPSGPRLFETLGIPLVAGRDFTLQDDDRSPKVAIINETTARHFFGPENPVGRRLGESSPGDTLIIGVVKDTKLGNLREEMPRVMYRSFLQTGPPRRMTFAVRTALPPMNMLTALRREIELFEPNLPLFGFTTLREVVARSLAQERLIAALSSLFGLLALALAAVGLYGLVAYSVSQRTREIGLRIALGAQRLNVLGLLMRQGMTLVIAGLAIGSLGSVGLTAVVATRLYGITPTDPAVLSIVCVLLLLIALIACFIPARRAAKLDPADALRYE